MNANDHDFILPYMYLLKEMSEVKFNRCENLHILSMSAVIKGEKHLCFKCLTYKIGFLL